MNNKNYLRALLWELLLFLASMEDPDFDFTKIDTLLEGLLQNIFT